LSTQMLITQSSHALLSVFNHNMHGLKTSGMYVSRQSKSQSFWTAQVPHDELSVCVMLDVMHCKGKHTQLCRPDKGILLHRGSVDRRSCIHWMLRQLSVLLKASTDNKHHQTGFICSSTCTICTKADRKRPCSRAMGLHILLYNKAMTNTHVYHL